MLIHCKKIKVSSREKKTFKFYTERQREKFETKHTNAPIKLLRFMCTRLTNIKKSEIICICERDEMAMGLNQCLYVCVCECAVQSSVFLSLIVRHLRNWWWNGWFFFFQNTHENLSFIHTEYTKQPNKCRKFKVHSPKLAFVFQ